MDLRLVVFVSGVLVVSSAFSLPAHAQQPGVRAETVEGVVLPDYEFWRGTQKNLSSNEKSNLLSFAEQNPSVIQNELTHEEFSFLAQLVSKKLNKPISNPPVGEDRFDDMKGALLWEYRKKDQTLGRRWKREDDEIMFAFLRREAGFQARNQKARELELPACSVPLSTDEKSVASASAPAVECEECRLGNGPMSSQNADAVSTSAEAARRLLGKEGVTQVRINDELNEKGIKRALGIIGQTPMGAQLLSKFMPLYEAGKLKIVFKKIADRGDKSGAEGAVFNLETKTIEISSSQQLGIGLVRLVHEMEHSLDPEFAVNEERIAKLLKDYEDTQSRLLSAAAKKTGKKVSELRASDLPFEEFNQIQALETQWLQARDVWEFKAERKGWDASERFITELSQKAPCFQAYTAAYAEKNFSIFQSGSLRMTNNQIINNYHLDPMNVQSMTSSTESAEPPKKTRFSSME